MSPVLAAPSRVIYGISLAAIPDQIRYIGLTRGTAEQRLIAHFKKARSGIKSIFYDWMRKHINEDFNILVLEICTDLSDIEFGQREIFWIAYYRELQGSHNSHNIYKLLNMSNGGINCVLTGDNNPKSNLGKKHSQSTKDKISKAHTGRIITDEHRINLSKAAKGKKLSEKTKLKISKSRKGIPAYNKGIPMSDEQKEKLRQANLGKIPWNKGLPNKSAHTRWHTNKNISKPQTCQYCKDELNDT